MKEDSIAEVPVEDMKRNAHSMFIGTEKSILHYSRKVGEKRSDIIRYFTLNVITTLQDWNEGQHYYQSKRNLAKLALGLEEELDKYKKKDETSNIHLNESDRYRSVVVIMEGVIQELTDYSNGFIEIKLPEEIKMY